MIIRLGSGERSICYYTRIAEPVDCYVSECVAFVKDFNDKTFNDETSGTLATYMERTTGDNTTLQFVSLNSSLKQVSWADFKGERLTEPVPSIKGDHTDLQRDRARLCGIQCQRERSD